MTVRTAPQPSAAFLREVACLFISIYLDDVAKRDLAVWFAEHPRAAYTAAGLSRRLGMRPAVLGPALPALREALAIQSVRRGGERAWQLTADVSTRQILQAAAHYLREHPDAHTLSVKSVAA